MKTTKIASLLTAFAMLTGTAAIPEAAVTAGAAETEKSTEGTYDHQTELNDPTSNSIESEDELENNCEPVEKLDYGPLKCLVFFGNSAEIVDCDEAVTEVEIPEEIHDTRVEEIDDYAFFNCNKLTTITIPTSVTHIGAAAFSGCESLTDVYYAGTEEEWNAIEISTYYNDALLAANIHYADGEKSTEPTDSPEPEYVSTDCYEYYRYSDHIELGNIFGGGDVVIPAEIDGLPVTSAEGANCVEDLTSIVLPDTMTEIPYFYRCDSLETIVLPKNLTAIGDWSFVECSNLKNIVIPDSVTSIGAAFEALPNLKTINIPANVKTIADGFIANCENLETIELSPDNPYFVFENGILMDAERTRVIVCLPKAAPKKIVLPDTVTSIGEFAFAGCNALQELKIPDSVTHIGAAAFWRCESLKELYIPEGVTELTSKPTEGGSYDTFEECIALEKLYLPATLTSTTCETFSGCANLKEIYFTGTQEQWDAVRIMNDRGEFEIGKYYIGYAYDEEQDRYVELEFDPTMHYNYVPESPVSLGNLNGDNSIDATDAAFLLSAAAAAGAGGESGLTAEQIKAADLNGDGAFDASDAALILMYAAYSGAGGDLSITDYLAQL